MYEEFGAPYFDLAQLTRISEETYREIAPAVSDGVLNVNGEQFALTLENSRKIAAVISKIRRAKRVTAITLLDRVRRMSKHYNSLYDELERVPRSAKHEFEELAFALTAVFEILSRMRVHYE